MGFHSSTIFISNIISPYTYCTIFVFLKNLFFNITIHLFGLKTYLKISIFLVFKYTSQLLNNLSILATFLSSKRDTGCDSGI